MFFSYGWWQLGHSYFSQHVLLPALFAAEYEVIGVRLKNMKYTEKIMHGHAHTARLPVDPTSDPTSELVVCYKCNLRSRRAA